MTQPPDDRAHTAPPLPPAQVPVPLNYARDLTARPPLNSVLQFFLGVLAWAAGLALVGGLYMLIVNSNSNLLFSPFILALVILLGLIFLSVYLRRTYGWRAFLPGVLIGVALSCLLPIGILLIVCASFASKMNPSH